MRALTLGSARLAAPRPAGLRRMRDGLRRHPEWWVLALCAAAWLCLLQRSGGIGFAAICRGGFAWRELGWPPAPDSGLPLMTAAMMLPLAAGPARYAAFHSLWRRRARAIAVFLCGYLGLWLAAAWLLDAASALWLSAVNNLSLSLAGAALAAAAWQLGPGKAAALAACHRGRALAPSGGAADRDCLLYGLQSGVACLRSCWLLMLLPGAGGHGLAVMLGVTALALAERYRRPAAAVSAAALLGLALWQAMAA